jgi:arylsulfatase A-like enzyme
MEVLSGRMLAGALTFAVAGMAWASAPERPTSTSVLLVTLDTTRADHLGCYGAAFAATPNLDELAREGVRFDEAISPTPLTLPSHASIFTGMVPRRHGVRDNALFRLGEKPDVLAGVLGRHGYTTAAFVSSVVLDRITGLDRGFEVYDDTVRVGARSAFDYRERAAIQTNDTVLRHLDGLEEPFFLWVHYFDPHLPYVPPEPFRGRFPGRPYDGEIAFMDQQLGRLLDAVRKRTASLLVVVAGDHGESLGEHGEDAHGVFLYRATQRVPLIVAGPGVPRGRVVPGRTGLVDVAPTLLDLLGLPPLHGVDGRSLVPLLRDEEVPPRAYELESLFPSYAYGWAPLRGLVSGGYKYIQAPRSELYRPSKDSREKQNLMATEAERASAMEEALHVLTAGDAVPSIADDPDLAERRRRLESLGYLTGGGLPEEGSLIDPKDGMGWIDDLAAGREAYQTGRPAEGVEPLRRLLSRNPRNVPALLALGMCYLGAGQADQAVNAGRRALAIRPDDDLVHFNLANAFAVLGEKTADARPEARKHYERALELNPRFADGYLNYASFLERVGSESEVRPLLERARLAGVRDPDLEIRIGMIELRHGNVELAMDALRRALELNPRAAGPLEALRLIEELSPDE